MVATGLHTAAASNSWSPTRAHRSTSSDEVGIRAEICLYGNLVDQAAVVSRLRTSKSFGRLHGAPVCLLWPGDECGFSNAALGGAGLVVRRCHCVQYIGSVGGGRMSIRSPSGTGNATTRVFPYFYRGLSMLLEAAAGLTLWHQL